MDYSSIKVNRYKLFDKVELSDLRKVNVIIGKNNSGKSSLIDVISAAYDVEHYEKIHHDVGQISGGVPITKEMVSAVFASYRTLARWDENSYAKAVVGKELDFNILLRNSSVVGTMRNKLGYELIGSEPDIQSIKNYWPNGINVVERNFRTTKVRRMRAERNIVPEASSVEGLSENGEGASSLIRKVISESAYDESIIEEKLLKALNDIMYPEAEYEAIKIQQITGDNNEAWEVYLQEKEQSRIPLSKMGSGLKTIILVLLNLLVIPELEKGVKYVYAFEEIENNLHPAMQRKIFEYLYSYAVEKDTTIYITTHSHVAINCFYDKEKAAIYHIEKNNGKASVKRIESYIDKAEILSDLDVKASDLLQSNGIIWVEGPSDRIYIKRWLEIFTDNKYIEGQHYQFLYYGGKLLSQYTVQKETDLISILTTNRNAAIVIDSDKRNQQASINSTKRRITDAFNELKMFNWVTKGKEIENYIPAAAISKLLGLDKIRQCGQYQLFPQYIEKHYKGFTGKKVQFANSIVSYMEKVECGKVLDVQKKIRDLYKAIEKWNA